MDLIRIRFLPSHDYYYYVLFSVEGSRVSDEDDDGENSSQNQASHFLVKNSLSPSIPNTIGFVFKNQIHIREQLSLIRQTC